MDIHLCTYSDFKKAVAFINDVTWSVLVGPATSLSQVWKNYQKKKNKKKTWNLRDTWEEAQVMPTLKESQRSVDLY